MEELSLKELSEIIDEVREGRIKKIPYGKLPLSQCIELHRRGIDVVGDGNRHTYILKPMASLIEIRATQISLN